MTPGADLVSIVIPTFNGERYLAEAIRSALEQDHSPVEVIVVDDGSTDGTPDVVARFTEVTYLRQENAGPSAARNAGIAVSTGAYLTFCDSDDRFRPSKVSVQLRYLEDHPEIDCVLIGHEMFLEPGIERPGWALDEARIQPESLMVRRRVVDAVGAFDPSFTFAEGIEWLSRMRSAGVGIAVIEDVQVDRRIHGGNLSYERADLKRGVVRVMQQRIAARRAEH